MLGCGATSTPRTSTDWTRDISKLIQVYRFQPDVAAAQRASPAALRNAALDSFMGGAASQTFIHLPHALPLASLSEHGSPLQVWASLVVHRHAAPGR